MFADVENNLQCRFDVKSAVTVYTNVNGAEK